MAKCNIIWLGIGMPLSYPIAFMIQKWHVGDLHVMDLVMPSHSYQYWVDITFLAYSPHKDICHYFMHWIKILHFYFKKNLDILIRCQIFAFFNLIHISFFLDIHCLFVNRISIDSDIKNSNICLPIMLGASLFLWGKKSPKGSILFLRGNILLQIIFKK
jgi:hypothetical protein